MPIENLLIPIQRNDAAPRHKQIIAEFVRLIDHGALKPFCSILATRTMAAHLGVNRSTFYQAYQGLIAMGYFDARPGSDTRVCKRPETMTSGSAESTGITTS
ncbi:hypothetical protein JXO59_11765 [candidate division KSB1 bacterium]|nr:hypothetical protein [candidate division KSB1 bacterium]